MTEYLVSVAASGGPFLGPPRTIARSVRVSATTPIEAGELVLDRFLAGPSWSFSSARATVIDAETHLVEATLTVRSPKPYGVRRYPTADAWLTPDDPAPEDAPAAISA